MRRLSALTLILAVASTLNACSNSERNPTEPGFVTFGGPNASTKPDEGGQPGAVELRGSLVKVSGRPTDAVKVRLEAGVDLKNERASLKRQTNFSTKLTAADRAEIDSTRGLDLAIRNNCWSHLADTKDFATDKNRSYEKNSVWKARVVVICNQFDFSAFESLKIVAEHVILDEAVFQIKGTKTSRLEIVTDDLTLYNHNSVVTKGLENLTEFGAPGVSFVANHVSGLGTLSIQAQGGDRRRAEEKPTPQLELPPGP